MPLETCDFEIKYKGECACKFGIVPQAELSPSMRALSITLKRVLVKYDNDSPAALYSLRYLLRRRGMYIYRCRQEVENSRRRDGQYLHGIDRG